MEVNDKVTLVEKVTNQFFRFINERSINVNWCFYIWLLFRLLSFLKKEKQKQKEKIDRFFKNYEKDMACSNQDLKEIDELCEKVENLLTENEKELQLSKVEFYLKA